MTTLAPAATPALPAKRSATTKLDFAGHPSHGRGMLPCKSFCPTCGDPCSRLHKATAKNPRHDGLCRHGWPSSPEANKEANR